ncbi:hypothetical protein DEO72_LG10g2619 [Vigna unguiculata]|uniref:Uncharacterized protein n=1 Tax=Vigna unguiculata TaxID=3917 RepID=A0A4D6NCE1_VIGUN|nr:hypothetical protein DEO72_LG10g2619 [Vigna unguiculata]
MSTSSSPNTFQNMVTSSLHLHCTTSTTTQEHVRLTVDNRRFAGNRDSHADRPPYALRQKARATRTKLTNQICELLYAGPRHTENILYCASRPLSIWPENDVTSSSSQICTTGYPRTRKEALHLLFHSDQLHREPPLNHRPCVFLSESQQRRRSHADLGFLQF